MLSQKGYNMNIFFVRVKIFMSNLNVFRKLEIILLSKKVGFGKFGAK